MRLNNKSIDNDYINLLLSLSLLHLHVHQIIIKLNIKPV